MTDTPTGIEAQIAALKGLLGETKAAFPAYVGAIEKSPLRAALRTLEAARDVFSPRGAMRPYAIEALERAIRGDAP